MKVEDFRPRGAGWTVQLHEKGRQGTCEAVFRYIVLFAIHEFELERG